MLKFHEKYLKPKENAYEIFFGKNRNMNVPLLDEVETTAADSKISIQWTSIQLTQYNISKVSLFVFAHDTQKFSSKLNLSNKLPSKRDSSSQIHIKVSPNQSKSKEQTIKKS